MTDNIRILINSVCDIFCNSFACASDNISFEQAKLVDFFHNSVDTASLVKFFHIVATSRSKVADVRSFFTDCISHIKVKLNATFVSDSWKMKHRVCTTTKSHIHCESVLECVKCHNVTRLNILAEKLHNLHTSVFSKLNSL